MQRTREKHSRGASSIDAWRRLFNFGAGLCYVTRLYRFFFLICICLVKCVAPITHWTAGVSPTVILLKPGLSTQYRYFSPYWFQSDISTPRIIHTFITSFVVWSARQAALSDISQTENNSQQQSVTSMLEWQTQSPTGIGQKHWSRMHCFLSQRYQIFQIKADIIQYYFFWISVWYPMLLSTKVGK